MPPNRSPVTSHGQAPASRTNPIGTFTYRVRVNDKPGVMGQD